MMFLKPIFPESVFHGMLYGVLGCLTLQRTNQKTEVSSHSRCVLRMFSQVSRGDAMLKGGVGSGFPNCRWLPWQKLLEIDDGKKGCGKKLGKE